MSADPAAGDEAAIARAPLGTAVADHLRDLIIRGDIGPGERVPVAAVATRLDVSMTPIREALIVLAEEGLVSLLPNRGARVLAYTADEARSLFEVIAALESLAAELATVRMSEAALADLERRHAAMAAEFARGDLEAYFTLNTGIHAAILALSGNADLVTAHGRLSLRATRGRHMAIMAPERWAQAMGEHEQVMAAFRARDRDMAARVWRAHLRRTGDAVGAALETAASHAG